MEGGDRPTKSCRLKFPHFGLLVACPALSQAIALAQPNDYPAFKLLLEQQYADSQSPNLIRCRRLHPTAAVKRKRMLLGRKGNFTAKDILRVTCIGDSVKGDRPQTQN